jgi:hypothetical protein
MQTALTDNDEESALLVELDHEPRDIDSLIRETDLPTMTVNSTLTMMENIEQIWYKKWLQRNPSHSRSLSS